MTYPLSPEFEIRRATAADRAAVIALVSEMWGEDISARYEWLYLANPHGRALTWVVIERTSAQAVACTSIFPRKVIVGGKPRCGSIGGDCYVLPRARRRGIATALHQVSLREMRASGVEFMYGPPNPNNLHALLKAGSHLVTTFKRFVRPLSGSVIYRAAFDKEPSRLQARLAALPIALLDRFTKIDIGGLTLEAVARFDAAYDALFERARVGRAVLCVRDSDYLNWRYFGLSSSSQRPLAIKRDGELVGFAALEQRGNAAAIIDLLTPADDHLTEAALQLLVNEIAEGGCSSLEMSCTPTPPFTAKLQRLGFVGRSERGFQVAVADDDPQREMLLDAAAWNFTAADQDMDSFFTAAPQ